MKRKPKGYWTKENCQIEALKYNTRSEFYKGSGSAYDRASKEGWLDDVCSHCGEKVKPKRYWTYETCKQEALKYKHRSEFREGSGSAYNKARKEGWLDELCSHMDKIIIPKKRYIYAFEFPKFKMVYVGLTCDLKSRFNSHTRLNNKKTAVSKFILFNKLSKKDYTFKCFSLYDEKDASIKEEEKLKEYLDIGWEKINIAKCGSLGGGNEKWTKETCKQEALKYNTRSEFQKGSKGAYYRARKEGWLDELCSHMEEKVKPKRYWTYETCKQEALKYNTRNEFREGCKGGYNRASIEGWLDDVCSHCGEKVKPKRYWTYETCKQEALKYKHRSEFRDVSVSSYNKARKEGWLDELCSHMEEKIKPKGYWTYETCKQEALKYNTRNEFREGSGSAYNKARKEGWLDKVCSHMGKSKKTK